MDFGAFRKTTSLAPAIPVGATVQVVTVVEVFTDRMAVSLSDGETEWKGRITSSCTLHLTLYSLHFAIMITNKIH